jgi:hypothetical protein
MLWDAEQSDRHPSRSLGTCRASPVALSRRAENGHALRGKGMQTRWPGLQKWEARPGSRRDFSRRSWIQARRWTRRLQSHQRSGAFPTANGCNRTLTWRGFLVVLPCHWRGFRSGQGRHLRMLASYTTRRLPSASLRCSWTRSSWFAGQRRAPSGWSVKSWPEKRPAFHAEPPSGGVYPEDGAVCDGGGERAGANSVVRKGSG